MRNVFAVLTLVTVLVSLAAFAGCSQASNGANETMKITLDDDDLTGNFMASRVPRSGFSRDPVEPRSQSATKQCFKVCSSKFTSCQDQRKPGVCRIEFDACSSLC